jgi:hypothetical protein
MEKTIVTFSSVVKPKMGRKGSVFEINKIAPHPSPFPTRERDVERG